MPKPNNDIGLTKHLADKICETNHFAQDVGGKLYRYVDGVYRSRGEQFVLQQVKLLCEQWKKTSHWSRRLGSEVIEYIRVTAPQLAERPPLDLVNVKNGLLRLTDRRLLPHSHEHLSPIQLPIKYDPAAKCKAIDSFVVDVFPKDARDLAWQVIGWLMAPDVSIQKAVLLLGAGGNGKSAWLAMVTKFLGTVNTAAVTLHRLESDRFSKARLIGKLANICSDLPTEDLQSTSVFKALTGGDAIEAEYKYSESFTFEPFARLVFSANSPPRSRDSSDGFFDRWFVIPFDARFRGTAKEISRRELDARLSSSQELSGALNRAIDAWQGIQKTGRLCEPESVKQAWREFHAATDPLAVWIDRYTIDDPQAYVAVGELRSSYNAHCDQQGRIGIGEKAFTLAMRKLRPQLQEGKRFIGGNRHRCFIGLGLADFSTDGTRGTGGTDKPYLLFREREDI